MQVTTSYAQNREDIIIDAFFEGADKGVYVDVGANHPIYDSVTKLFYIKGWRGVHIEPNKQLARLIQVDRPGDVVLQVGISDHDGSENFRIYENTGLSTFSAEIQRSIDPAYDSFKQKYEDVETKVMKLSSALRESGVEGIDFLKIDIEGLEYEALTTNDWERYRPELICIEANHIVKDWHSILLDSGYVKFFNDGLNEYYALQDSDRLKKFSYPESVLMRYPHVVSFVPHSEKHTVSAETFSYARPAVEREALNKQLIGAYNVFNGVLRTILLRRIVQLKRDTLRRAIVRSGIDGRGGTVDKVSYASAKIITARGLFYGHGVASKVIRRIGEKVM